MSRLSARVERIEPQITAAWSLAWEAYARKIDRAIPNELWECALLAADDEVAWRDFQAAHGLNDLAEWFDDHDVCPVDHDAPDLSIWPTSIPQPPAEPTGVWNHMQQLHQGTDDAAGAYAALALLLLGLARCVRLVDKP